VASVFLKRRTWYLKIQDASGRWVARPSKARNKTEAKGLAAELEAQVDRQRKGLEPLELPDGGGTVDELMGWWIEKFLRKAGSSTGESSIRKHIIGSPLGKLRLTDITPGKVDLFLTEKEDGLSARSVNHLRGYLGRAFTMARRTEKFPRPNPVADVPKRKVAKRLPDYLRPNEVQPPNRSAQAEVEAALRNGALHRHAKGRAVRTAEERCRLRRRRHHGQPVA
jgi:hypothetical protein